MSNATPAGDVAGGLIPPATVRRAEAFVEGLVQRVADLKAGMADQAEADVKAAASPAGVSVRPATERADQALDRAGERLGHFASSASLYIRKTAALAREEAEDILAEAQALRRPA